MMETMRGGAAPAKQGANRWTDNVFMLKSWVEKKMGRGLHSSTSQLNLSVSDTRKHRIHP